MGVNADVVRGRNPLITLGLGTQHRCIERFFGCIDEFCELQVDGTLGAGCVHGEGLAPHRGAERHQKVSNRERSATWGIYGGALGIIRCNCDVVRKVPTAGAGSQDPIG